MANEISANELKVKGISAIDDITSQGIEAVITVRGKQKYIVMTIEEYNRFREYELESAINESKKDIELGNFKIGTVDEHLLRIDNV